MFSWQILYFFWVNTRSLVLCENIFGLSLLDHAVSEAFKTENGSFLLTADPAIGKRNQSALVHDIVCPDVFDQFMERSYTENVLKSDGQVFG